MHDGGPSRRPARAPQSLQPLSPCVPCKTRALISRAQRRTPLGRPPRRLVVRDPLARVTQPLASFGPYRLNPPPAPRRCSSRLSPHSRSRLAQQWPQPSRPFPHGPSRSRCSLHPPAPRPRPHPPAPSASLHLLAPLTAERVVVRLQPPNLPARPHQTRKHARGGSEARLSAAGPPGGRRQGPLAGAAGSGARPSRRGRDCGAMPDCAWASFAGWRDGGSASRGDGLAGEASQPRCRVAWMRSADA